MLRNTKRRSSKCLCGRRPVLFALPAFSISWRFLRGQMRFAATDHSRISSEGCRDRGCFCCYRRRCLRSCAAAVAPVFLTNASPRLCWGMSRAASAALTRRRANRSRNCGPMSAARARKHPPLAFLRFGPPWGSAPLGRAKESWGKPWIFRGNLCCVNENCRRRSRFLFPWTGVFLLQDFL